MKSLLKKIYLYLFIYLSLCWVFIALHEPSPVAESGDYFLVSVCGLQSQLCYYCWQYSLGFELDIETEISGGKKKKKKIAKNKKQKSALYYGYLYIWLICHAYFIPLLSTLTVGSLFYSLVSLLQSQVQCCILIVLFISQEIIVKCLLLVRNYRCWGQAF